MNDLDGVALQHLATAIRKARANAKLSQEQAAFAADMSVRHYQELESGRLNPSYLVLRQAAKAFGTTLARIASAAERATGETGVLRLRHDR